MTVAKPLMPAASLRSWKALPMASLKCDVFHPTLRVLVPVDAEDGNVLRSLRPPFAVRVKELGTASGRARPLTLKAGRSKHDFFFQPFRFDAPA